MQVVSIETISGLERRVTIGVPAAQINGEIESRIKRAARNAKLKGFRPGKVPLSVVKTHYEPAIRQEVLDEVIRQSFYEATTQEQLKPAGFPQIQLLEVLPGEDVQFSATFEVYPEVHVGDCSQIKVEKLNATINDADVEKMIESLRKQQQTWTEIDRAAADGDSVNIDFEGSVDGELFEGGSAKDVNLVLGSNQMIPGFEEGLIGAKAGEKKTLNVTFPVTYQAENLAGKAAEFKVMVNKVSEGTMPALDKDFFEKFGIKADDEQAFRAEVRTSMEKELKSALERHLKNQVMEGLVQIHQFDIPKALIDNEINLLRKQALQQFMGDRADTLDASKLPAELFSEQAQRRVRLGLILGEIIRHQDLKADQARVRAMIEEVASTYNEPEQVVNWYLSNPQQLREVETMVLEESVVHWTLSKAQVTDKTAVYEEVMKTVSAQK
jgi:trigger factor